MGYRIVTTQGNVYETDNDGAVITRSNGPKGWDYSGKWVLIGIGKRHHSRQLVTLADAANGADIGQGWVTDWDHGTFRRWGMERVRSIVATR